MNARDFKSGLAALAALHPSHRGLDARITGIKIPGMSRFRIALSVAWWVLALVVLVSTIRLTRYETLTVGELPLVLDRWRGEFCTVAAGESRRCFPVR